MTLMLWIEVDSTGVANNLDWQVGNVGGEAQKNILLVLLWAPTNVGEKHCQVCPKRLVACQE